MTSVGFEPTISAGKLPQTYTLDRAATGTGMLIQGNTKNGNFWKIFQTIIVFVKNFYGESMLLTVPLIHDY